MMACNDRFTVVGENSDEREVGAGSRTSTTSMFEAINKNCLFFCDKDSGRNENIRTHIHRFFTLMIFSVRLNMGHFSI